MFQIDEKVLKDNRTLVTIQSNKNLIDVNTKNGTIHYSQDTDDLWLTTPKIRKAYVNKDPNIHDKFDKILTAKDGQKVDGDLTFEGAQHITENLTVDKDLLVKGNLTIQGESSILNTTSLSIEDNIVELNRNETNNGVTLNIAGIAVNRGSKRYARYLYSEKMKAFSLDTSQNIDDPINEWLFAIYAEDNGPYKKGDIRTIGKFMANDIQIGKEANVNILNTGDLHVYREAIFDNPVTINSLTTMNGVFVANKNVDLKGVTTLWDTTTFKKAVTFEKGINVSGITTIENMNINGNINSTGNITAEGNAVISGTLNVSENSIFNKDIEIQGYASVNQILANGATLNQLNTNNASIRNDMNINGNLSVIGESTFENIVTANNGLNVSSGNVALNGAALNVDSIATFARRVTINNDLTANNINARTMNLSEDIIANSLTLQNATINNTLTVKGLTRVEAKATIKEVLSESNISVTGNGYGYRLDNTENAKIYLHNTTTEGAVDNASSSDKNIYFKNFGGTNRGFIFKNANNLVQIEGNGTIRAINDIYSKGYKVLTEANMGHMAAAGGIDACTLDGKHAHEIMSSDGSISMTGDLNLGSNNIKFRDNDYIKYSDNAVTIENDSYGGTFNFISDNINHNSVLNIGGIDFGNGLKISGKSSNIGKVKDISGAFGHIISSVDEWLRINSEGSDVHTQGVYFGNSTVRTNKEFIVGANGSIFKASSSELTHNGSNILTASGINAMNGDINMGRQKIKFIAENNSGVTGAASTDIAQIYGEHNLASDVSRLVFEVGPKEDDKIVFKTRQSASVSAKDSLTITNSKAIFSDNPYYGVNRLLHTGDTGSGKGLDADTLDGKHASSFALNNHTHTVATTSANGFMTAADKTKLNSIAENANNYSHPSTHDASMITQSSNYRFVTDAEKTTWNGKANANHTHNYLPLSGGTLTGNVNTSSSVNFTTANTSGIRFNNSLIIRNNGTSTVLSSINNTMYFRPQGDTNETNQATLSTNGDLTAVRFVGNLQGNANTATAATRLKTARKINGTDFNGAGDITTANWGASRNIQIGNTVKSVNGSGNITWSLTEIGAVPSTVNIPNGADLNNYIGEGRYNAHTNAIAQSCINKPPGEYEAFSLEVTKSAGTTQVLTTYNQKNFRVWRRNEYGGVWGDWYLQVDSRKNDSPEGGYIQLSGGYGIYWGTDIAHGSQLTYWERQVWLPSHVEFIMSIQTNIHDNSNCMTGSISSKNGESFSVYIQPVKTTGIGIARIYWQALCKNKSSF